MSYSSLSFTTTVYQTFIMEFSSLLEIIIIISSVLSVVHKHEAVLFFSNDHPNKCCVDFFFLVMVVDLPTMSCIPDPICEANCLAIHTVH